MTEYRATGGPVNSGRFIIPDVIGSSNCPPIKPDLTGLQEEFEKELLDAMNTPIADLDDSPFLGCFVIKVPKVADPEQLASRVSRDVEHPRFAIVDELTGEDADAMMKRVHEILDRKQAERDNIND